MSSPPDQRMAVDDVLELDAAGDVALTPDGQVAFFVLGKSYDEKDERSPKRIMAVPLDSSSGPRPYTAGDAVDTTPRPSPDGTMMAFLSDRPRHLPDDTHAAKTQVYLLPRDGGEARRLTSVAGKIENLAWMPDSSRLVVLMAEPVSDEERKREEERGGAVDVEARPRFWRLWAVDRESGEITALTPAGVQVWEFGLSPDGRQAALVVSDLPYEWAWYQARLAVAPLDTSDVRTIYTTPRQIAHPRISPDGATVSVTSCTWSDRGAYGGDVLLIPATGGEARNLTEGRPISVTWTEWDPDGKSLLCCGYDEGQTALWRLGHGGDLHTVWKANVALAERWQPRFSRAGQIVALLRQDSTNPTDLWVAQLNGGTIGEWRQITRLHREKTATWRLDPLRTLRWKAPDGTAIQGLLALPPDYDDSTRLPLVVLVHGGPTALHTYGFNPGVWTYLLVARGIAVLLPNPRGSTGWGAAFAEANLGDMGGADLGDIMAGVDHLIDSGVADPERLGIGGWSYGGFMTARAVTQTDRFKAAVMGAGITDWRSFHGVSTIPTWDALFYGSTGHPADPYDTDGPYASFSPLTHIARVTTPTLILHGERDDCVPIGQGYQFFRALRDRGVPVEMTVYPRAGHGLRERAHLADAWTRVVEWFERYLNSR